VWCAKTCFHCFWPLPPYDGALFSKDFAFSCHARGDFAETLRTRKRFLGERARRPEENNRRFSRGIGHLFAPAAARIVRPRGAHAELQNRPGGGNWFVFLEKFAVLSSRILLCALSAEVTVKGQKRGPPGTGPLHRGRHASPLPLTGEGLLAAEIVVAGEGTGVCPFLHGRLSCWPLARATCDRANSHYPKGRGPKSNAVAAFPAR